MEQEKLYAQAVEEMETATVSSDYLAIAEKFRALGDFKDSAERAEQCVERHKSIVYGTAMYMIKGGWEEGLNRAAKMLESILDYEDSAEQLKKCRERLSAPVKTDFTFVTEIAALISDNDQEVLKNLEDALKAPRKYFTKNSKRFRAHDMEIGDYVFSKKTPFDYSRSMDEVLWTAMIDELCEGGYLIEAELEWELDEFLERFAELKWFGSHRDAAEAVRDAEIEEFLDEWDDELWGVDYWCGQIDSALGERAVIGYVDSSLDINLAPVFVADSETFAKISAIAEENGHKILSY